MASSNDLQLLLKSCKNDNIKHYFATDCAERALIRERSKGREPDARSWAAIEAKRAWLLGDLSNDQLEEDRNAAYAAADAAYAAYAAAYAAVAYAAVAYAAAAYAAAAERDWQLKRLSYLIAVSEVTCRLYLVYDSPDNLPIKPVKIWGD